MLNQLVRYAPVLAMLREKRGSVLEVGSGQAGISQFLGRRVTGLEIRFPGPPGPLLTPVVGTATHLPFANRSFDVVLVMDTLEHIPPELRDACIEEAMRVTRDTLIIGGPMGPAARGADAKLVAYYEKHRIAVPDWLRQHIEREAPDVEAVTRPLRASGWRVEVRGNENVQQHLALMKLETKRLWYRGFAEVRTRAPNATAAVARRLRMPPYYSYVVSARRDASARSQDSSITSTIGPQS
jgi:hypothetical protein